MKFPDSVVRHDPHLLQVRHYYLLCPVICMAYVIAYNSSFSTYSTACHILNPPSLVALKRFIMITFKNRCYNNKSI
jgi:hypothetical protein